MKWIMAVVFGLVAIQANGEEMPVLKTQKDMQSYGIGVNIAKSFKKNEVEFDLELLVRGLKDMLSGERLLMPEKDLRKVMNSFQGELRQKEAGIRRVATLDNKAKGEAFLSKNKTRDDVVALASGVQYKILKEGEGKKPTDADMVECIYRGTLLDGTEFDVTDPEKPATLKVAQLIAGWKEALKLMPEGSKWQIFIPPQLAYGQRGVGSDIGPNETLVFDVELLAVK